MITVDQEKLENVLAAEVGQHRAMELISLFEAAGALRAMPDTALVTAEQAAEWAGLILTDGDVGWLRREIPKTPIPDAISLMAVSLTVPDDPDTGGTADLGDCLRPTGDQGDPSWYPYFPAVLQELYDKATDTEASALDALSVARV
ncbi:hypothetical protein [Amycolatopsis sp. cmx-4-61]|uniref:hypothetical protein n=1 Tax=Amycolatopsis sp. cmx-4-61 TaxID=2790937 RepID=UPI0039797962